MNNGPVYLRLCTNEMLIVSQEWWDKFLRSQAKSMDAEKRLKKLGLDRDGAISTSITNRGGVDGILLEQRQEGRGHSVEVRR